MNTRSKDSEDDNSGSGLEIIPIRPLAITETKKYHPNLPSINRNAGSIILAIGATSAGKTTTIVNMVLGKNFWGGKKSAFEKIYLFSPSVLVDDSIRHLKEVTEWKTDFKDEYLQQILASQLAFDKKDMPKILIIVDDAVGLIHRNSALNKFLSRYRHYNANVIMSVQHFRSISPIGRANATNVLLFNGIVNAKEMEKIQEEWGGVYKDTLERMYYKYANKKYQFLHLFLRKNPAEMFLNFQKKLNWEKFVSKKIRDKMNGDEEEYLSE
tara:strand:- start:3261 stop:4067 length:807 start_codon:yes stop_codon:yes gene_type:complete